MPTSSPSVSVVIPNWNGANLLPRCLDALRAQTFRDFEVVVVDNGSRDASRALLRERYAEVRRIELPRNLGFAAAVNAGIRAGAGEFVALLNNDTQPRPGWLGALVDALRGHPPQRAAATSKMLDLADPTKIENAGIELYWNGLDLKRGVDQPAADFTESGPVFCPSAGAGLYRRSFLEELGGFDETFESYLEDVDLGLRGRIRGYHYVFAPAAEVLHQGHGSGLPHPRYVRLITRNRLLLLTKCLPPALLRRHAATLWHGQWYFALCNRRPLASLRGYAEFLRHWPAARRSRRALWQAARIDPEKLEGALLLHFPRPPLLRLIRQRLGCRS